MKNKNRPKKVHTNSMRILLVSTTASMIEQFNLNNILLLQSLGAEVHVATNFNSPGTITEQQGKNLVEKLTGMEVKCHQVDFLRGLGNPIANKKAYRQLCDVVCLNSITGIHTHSPLGSIIARRVAHRYNIKILYTAHGFQFFPKGPLLNWVLFWPIEWFYARWTDALVTINRDDFESARHLPVNPVYYIPGVGSKINRAFSISQKKRMELRRRFRINYGISDDDYLMISVGELSKRKNHQLAIKAMYKLNNPKIKYIIAGIGPEKNHLLKLVNKYGLNDQVLLMGYTKNLDALYFAADLNIFVSKREGLGLGGLDGVAHGVYIIGNGRTGMKDYILDDQIGLLQNDPDNVNELVTNIKMSINKKHQMSPEVKRKIRQFDQEHVNVLMKKIYHQVFFTAL